MLALGDMRGKKAKEVKEHLVSNWTDFWDEDVKEYVPNDNLKNFLEDKKILIAYESVGDYGCDSEGTYVFEDPEGDLHLFKGSHCSCYGFEDQGTPENISIEALSRMSLSVGGYDNDGHINERRFREEVKRICLMRGFDPEDSTPTP